MSSWGHNLRKSSHIRRCKKSVRRFQLSYLFIFYQNLFKFSALHDFGNKYQEKWKSTLFFNYCKITMEFLNFVLQHDFNKITYFLFMNTWIRLLHDVNQYNTNKNNYIFLLLLVNIEKKIFAIEIKNFACLLMISTLHTVYFSLHFEKFKIA